MTVDEKKAYLLGKENYNFEDLVILVEVLRSEKGCPWDREQTHKSIRNDIIEETYEVIEAIDTDNVELLREELGDVLLQTVFHSVIEDEKGNFNTDEVTDGICKKLIHRHPHVFGDVLVKDTDNVLSNWEQIKSEEKSRVTVTDKLKAVPPMLPALMRAQKVGKKAKCFDFSDEKEVMDKLYEELDELKAAMDASNQDEVFEEMGDLLLTVTSLCRKLGVDAELSLTRATDKFIDRFETIENSVIENGMDIENASVVELNTIWNEIKHKNTQKK